MSSTRAAPRATTVNKASSLNTHHTNGSSNTYDVNDSTVNTSNTSEMDSNLQRSVLTKNMFQSEGIYRNSRFVHAVTIGLVGQPVLVQTNERERFHGILETISPNGDVILSVAHRLDNNNNDIMASSTSLTDLFETMDGSAQSFELNKRIIPSANIVEIIASDMDLTGSGKCMLEENPKVSQLEDDRFNRMEHFYGSDDIDPDTFEDLEIGDDGKAGYDPEDMFNTNREKFNTTTDFDESKYTNVPVRQMTTEEQEEIERKVAEIEKGGPTEDIDEDDAGVKRPSELNQTNTVDDGNSNSKTNQSSRAHPNDRRSDFRYDGEYNPKRGNWREQRTGGGNNRRGGSNNYSMNNQKANQRSEQAQYTSSRSSEQSTNTRQQYKSRNNRFTENRSPHEGRDSPSQAANDETARSQRINSGSLSQGQNSGPTSPSTNVPGRTIYPTTNRPPIGRNSPAPYTGSSSSRNNSTTGTTTSPSPTTTTTGGAPYQTSSTGTGNYAQQSNNKMARKPSRNEQQTSIDETDQPKPQRNQHQTSSNNQSNSGSLNRPSQLHTQQLRQQQQQQQPQQQQQQQVSSSNVNVPPPLTMPPQDDHSSSHDSINQNQSDQTIHMTNPPAYAQHTTGTLTPGNTKSNSGLNPEADEFVPVFSRESSSRPESRGASAGSIQMNAYIQHSHPQAIQLLQQQQQQQQVQQTQVPQSSMIPQTHPQNPAALYQQYYPQSFPNMAQFVNPATQQMNVSMMGTQMMQPQTPQQMSGNGSNPTGPGGIATPSGGSGATYKTNAGGVHGGDAANTGVNNVAPKKAVVSVQRPEQSNVPQQQVTGAPSMVYPTAAIRYYSPDYMAQQTPTQSMQLQQIPFYYPINTQGIIQATATSAQSVGPPQSIMIPSTNSSAGPGTSAPPPIYYPGVYTDPRVYGMYSSPASVNPGGVNPNWQVARSPPHQQQPNDQQRAYVSGQNVVSQVPQQAGAQNTGVGGANGRSSSTTGPSGQSGVGTGGPSMTPQYALNGNIPTTYAYGSPAAWYSAPGQVPSPQTNMPPQVNAYGVMYDQSQQAPPQPTYVHPSQYDAAYFQQTQQGLDTVPPGNYNR